MNKETDRYIYKQREINGKVFPRKDSYMYIYTIYIYIYI